MTELSDLHPNIKHKMTELKVNQGHFVLMNLFYGHSWNVYISTINKSTPSDKFIVTSGIFHKARMHQNFLKRSNTKLFTLFLEISVIIFFHV